MAFEHLLDFLEIAHRRGDHPAGTHQRLGKEGANGVGTFTLDQCFQLGGQAGGEGFFALAWQPLAVIVRAGDMQEAGERQAEILM